VFETHSFTGGLGGLRVTRLALHPDNYPNGGRHTWRRCGVHLCPASADRVGAARCAPSDTQSRRSFSGCGAPGTR